MLPETKSLFFVNVYCSLVGEHTKKAVKVGWVG